MWVVIGPPPLASRDQRRVSVLGKRCLLHGSDTRHGSRAVKAAQTAVPTTQHRCACRLVSPNTEALVGRPGEPLASGRPHFGQLSSFIQPPQICAECLLCSRPCCGYQGHRWEQNQGELQAVQGDGMCQRPGGSEGGARPASKAGDIACAKAQGQDCSQDLREAKTADRE